jgi:phage host-nuclease inhibitor protein Gam
MAKSNVLKMTAPAKKPVPQSREDAAQALSDLGMEMSARIGLEATMNAEIAEVTGKYTPEIQGHLDKEAALFDGLQAWAEGNRSELCKGDSKTIQLGTGEVGWRLGQEALRYKGALKISPKIAALLVSLLKSRKLLNWVRIKEEVNKEAILEASKDPKAAKLFKDRSKVAGIDGLAIVQDEKFRAQALGVDTEKMAS